MVRITDWLVGQLVLARLRLAQTAREERGDVPGWVMITVMTAALVVAILVPFRTAIVNAVQNALDNVTGSAGS
jgi:hypothetical protein